MPAHFRRYLHMVEREASEVDPLWKVLHALIFIVIVALSFTAAFTFHQVMDAVSLDCMLYAKPALRLSIIQYPPVTTTMPNDLLVTLKRQDDYANNDTTTTDTAITTSTKAPDFEVIDNEYWFQNSTLRAKVVVDFRQTISGSKSVCHTVLFFPFVTLVLGSFAVVIVLMCGRGGKGYDSDLLPRPWRYVYPFLFLSLVMLIFNCIAVSWLHNGMTEYCLGFSKYTEENECSEKINHFKDEEFGVPNLYETYHICVLSLYSELIMWISQTVLIMFRIFYVADFKPVMMKISCNRRRSVDRDVHEALTKNHKLKTVTFDDKKSSKSDDDEEVTQV